MIRRIVMWISAGVLALSLVAWVASTVGVSWIVSEERSVALRHGALSFVEGSDPEWRTERAIPLRIPAAIATVVLAAALIVGLQGRKRQLLGLCPSCAYDLTGITGTCPECGREREPAK